MIDTVVVAIVNGPIVRFILHTVAVSKHAKSQLAGAAALTGNGAGVGVGFGVDAEPKEKPVLVVVGITGVLRLMGLRLDVGTVDGMTGVGSWTLSAVKEGAKELTAEEGDDGTVGGRTEEGVAEDCAGGKPGGGPALGTAGEYEHGTVTVESMKTVLIPSAPVVGKMDGPPGTTGFVVGVNDGASDGGVGVLPKLTLDDVVVVVGVENEGKDDPGVLVGTIPPKLNVFGEGVEPN
jgi:hypothetical protein